MSKLILFDFQCTTCDAVFEELVTTDTVSFNCHECDGAAVRIISGTHIDPKLGVSNDFPTMARRWEKKTRQRAKRDNSDYHTNQNLWMH